MLEDLGRYEDSRRRYKLLIEEIFRRAETPTAASLALQRAGFARKSDRTMTGWKNLESMPNPVELFALASAFQVDVNSYLFGELPPAGFPERVDRTLRLHGRKIGWLTDMVDRIAERGGWDDLLAPRPEDEPGERAEEA